MGAASVSGGAQAVCIEVARSSIYVQLPAIAHLKAEGGWCAIDALARTAKIPIPYSK